MRKPMLALIVTAALAAACSASGQKDSPLASGDTPLPGTSSSPLPGVVNSPGAVVSPTVGPSATASAAANGTTGATTGGSTTGTSGSSGSGSTTGTTGGPSADLRTGRGITPTSINIGIMYSSDQSAAGAQLGGSGAADPQKETANAIVQYINKNGGIAGRQIKPTWYDVQYTNGTTDAQRAQEQCAAFTEDSTLFAAGPFPVAGEVQATCLHKAGVLMINDWLAGRMRWDDVNMRNFPNLWTPVAPTFNRAWSLLVKEATAQKYFTSGAKVAAAIFNTPAYNRSIDNTLKPKLKALGVTLTDVCKIRPVYDVNDVAGAQSDVQACVLRFKSEGITHVMGGSPASNLFQLGTDQSFRPRLALFTGGLGGEQSLSKQDISGAFKNAVAVGWEPQVDTATAAAMPSSFSKTCLDIVKKAGVDQANTSESFSYCDFLFFLKAAMERAPAFTVSGFAQGAHAVKSSFIPSLIMGTDFSNRQDGPSLYRRATYDFACHNAGKEHCWKYTSGPLPF